jgi:hypothetical protein
MLVVIEGRGVRGEEVLSLWACPHPNHSSTPTTPPPSQLEHVMLSSLDKAGYTKCSCDIGERVQNINHKLAIIIDFYRF